MDGPFSNIELSRDVKLHSGLLLAEWIQVALLWALGQRREEAFSLIQWFFPLLKHPTLWAREQVYNEKEFDQSLSVLFAYLRLTDLSSSLPLNPFFSALVEKLLKEPFSSPPPLSDVLLDEATGLWVNDRVALTLSGYGTSLGSLRGQGAEIRAFGPQFYPLARIELFGVQGSHAAQSMDSMHVCGFTCCFGQNDVWLQAAMSEVSRQEWNFSGNSSFCYRLDIRWIGASSEKKGAFVFYVKGKEARIGCQIFRSNSLERYRGYAEKISFQEGALTVMCLEPEAIELIPLAGEGCFWGADFILSFTVNPLHPLQCFYVSCQ